MKKLIGLCLVLVLTLAFGLLSARADHGGTTIQDGVIVYSPGHYLAGQPIPLGFDPYGYNYQAGMFRGSYANVYLGGNGFPPYQGDTEGYLAQLSDSQKTAVQNTWYWPYRDDQLIMNWNEGWLSNQDGDGDGKLDRHPGYSSYVGSGAWENNIQSGEYLDAEGKNVKWTYFVKIVAVPADATLVSGVWYGSDGKEIGPSIWGQFAIIEEVYNDPGAGEHGILYLSPSNAGYGSWGPQGH